ncbi:MAG TPA: putative N-acetylmannosamine-6-phosphate 2-epimerase [Bryobacteraceae bacterium]|jgi:N-acetylmannosamine-6-phosphate 2-epimerase/N-acetylmannosamine kinase|nr:putative N-acetylmannosamine-6-phosphate 2-epimerase [Bryobacteraceae bacterium]
MERISELLERLRGRLIVSCQAREQDAFHGPENMARFARAAVEGGAAGIRANGPDDVRAIRAAVDVPIIGIQKRTMPDGQTLITPKMEDAAQLNAAGADMVALDCTVRGQNYGALERVRRIKSEMKTPVAADIATLEEARAAAEVGADFVLSTMRGYTAETAHATAFDPGFIAELVRAVPVPVIAEGRIWTREEARAAFAAGAFAVVIGSAITRPREITARFAAAIRSWNPANERCIAGIDLGGTNIKSGLVSANGQLSGKSVAPTRVSHNRAEVLKRLIDIGRALITAHERPDAVGIASAGWVDAQTGRVVYGTANLPDWTGTPVADSLAAELGIPVFVENDANAAAIAEKRFGVARAARDFVCITLGTGVGAGCYVRGELNRGAHSMANALGHLVIEPGGLLCTCGRRGCLEQYANSTALLRYAGAEHYSSAADVIAGAHRGDENARQAIRTLAGYLARGCALVIELMDPELIVVSGGLAERNPLLVAELELALATLVPLCRERGIAVRQSALGYFGGVLGAAAVALERLP